MTEPAASGRPTGGGGGSRSSAAVRHGFEPYNPGSRAAARRATGGTGGHDTARGRGLWESDRESGRPSRAEKDWKHDMFDDASVVAAQQQQSARGSGERVRGRGVSRTFGAISTSDSAGSSLTAGVSSASNGNGGAVETAVVPSGEKYEDLSRKVEEEVVAKLARAQMMGMMLKAHKEKQQQQQAQGADKRRGGVGNGSGSSTRRSRAGSSSNRQNRGGGPSPAPIVGLAGAPGRRRVNPLSAAAAAAEESTLIGKTPPGQGRRVPGTSDEGEPPRMSGILKVSSEVLHSKVGTETRVGSDATTIPPLSLVSVATSRDSQSDLSTQDDALGFDPGAMSIEEAYVIVGKLEQRHKAMAEELRKDIGLVQSGRGRPEDVSASRVDVSPGSVALIRRVSRLRTALSRTLSCLVLRDPALSLRKRLPNRLWMAHYRELEMIQHRLRQLGQTRQQQQQREMLRARLLVLIEEAERDIGGMVESVEQQMGEALSKSSRLTSSGSPSSSRASLSPPASSSSISPIDGINTDLDTANADAALEGLGEQQQREMEKSSSCDGGDEEDEVVSQEGFGRRQALQAFLTNLGDLSRYRGLYAEAALGGGERAACWLKADDLYRRALEVDPSSGKVWNQIAVLASCRQDNLKAFYAYLRGVCAGVPYPPGRESLLVLHENCKARLSTVKEATALDALGFEEHRARFRLYLLGACGTCLSRVDLGAFDGYLALSGRHMVSCVQLYLMKADADRGPAKVVGEGSLEETLARAIVLCICTASASFDAWRARDTGDGSWTTDAATSRAVRLCMTLAASLSGLHRKTSRRGWERVTAAGLSVFLDWLTCKPQFGEGARGTRGGLEEFQYVMACVVEFANGIFRSTGSGKGNSSEKDVDPDMMLWEDEECRGLPALSMATERRWAKHNRKKSSVYRERSNTNNNDALPPSMETPSEGRVDVKDVGGSRGPRERGARGGSRRRGASGARLGSSADEKRVMTGGKNEGEVQVDRWKILLARIRRQVEFCVERGWIARGNRPGTYTLPKPPPSGSTRHGSPRRAEGFSDRQRGGGGGGGRPSARQRDLIPAASATTSGKRDQPRTEHVTAPLPRSSSLALPSASPFPAPAGGGRFVAENDSVALVTGHAANTIEAQASVQATAQAEAVAVAQALSSLHLEMQAQEQSNGISSIHNDMQKYGTVAPMAPPPNYVPPGFPESSGVVYPGNIMSVSGNTVGGDNYMIGAAEVEGMERVVPMGLDSGYDGGGVGGERDSNPLPESLLGIVLAGLGSAEENLCAYCFATLGTGALECSTCGTPVPVPAAADGSAEVIASGGATVTISGSPRAVDSESDRDDQQRLLGKEGISERPVPILPAGVLAVNNLEEVIASSSQRPKSPMTGPPGGGQRGSGRSRSYNHKNDSSIASMARAGLGDGGGRLGNGPSSGAGGGEMFGWPRGAPRPSALPLVVIDVPNVAMRHGLNKKFSCKGVQMAVEYFRTAGHRVVGFLPDYHLDQQRTNGLERAKKLGVAEVKASRLPDDIPLLQRLVDDGVIVATPPQDYDDSYCIKYAMARGGYLVTNDLYRDHIKAKGTEGRKKADAARRWIKSHSISYTFVGDEFFPNPDFSFNQDQQGGGGAGPP